MAKAVRRSRRNMFFVTMGTLDRRPVFEISRVAELFIETLLHYRTLGQYKLHAYVVMPDHVQLVLTPESITLDQAVGLIKNGFSYRLDGTSPVWEDGFTGYSIANNHDLEIVRACIHQLPVRANLVTSAELYPYSSAYHQAPLTASTASRAVVSSPSESAEQASLRKLES
jgi:putative transposase